MMVVRINMMMWRLGYENDQWQYRSRGCRWCTWLLRRSDGHDDKYENIMTRTLGLNENDNWQYRSRGWRWCTWLLRRRSWSTTLPTAPTRPWGTGSGFHYLPSIFGIKMPINIPPNRFRQELQGVQNDIKRLEGGGFSWKAIIWKVWMWVSELR